MGADNLAVARPWLKRVAERLEHAHDFDDAMDVLLDAAHEMGFQGVDYSYVLATRIDGAWVSPPVASRAFPSGWERQWHRYSADDPYYHACLEGRPWVDWSEVQARRDLTRRQRKAIAYLKDVGLSTGITVPIRLNGGRLAFVTGVQPSSNSPDIAADRLLAMAHYFHGFVQQQRLLREWQPAVPLTPRELECLALAAHGHTAVASAARLHRSAETVRLHLKHAIAKLGAHNVTHAVAKATRLELI